MPHKGQTISQRGLESQDFLVIHFSPSRQTNRVSGDDVRTKTSELWFFQVADVSELNYEPLRIRDENGLEAGPINPGEGVEYNQLYDSSGNDILRNSDDPWRVYHYSLGVRQPGVRIYPRIPDANFGGTFSWLSGSEPRPEDGDPVGYINSEETDYRDPSAKLESIMMKQDSVTQTQYGFYVEDGEVPKQPIISIRGFGYELRPVYRDDEMLEILADLSRDDPVNNVNVVDYVRNGLQPYSLNSPSEWDSAQNNLTISDVNTPRGIERELGLDGEFSEEELVSIIESVSDDIGEDPDSESVDIPLTQGE